METVCSDKIAAFDTLFTTNHIQILKILLPGLSPAAQRQLAVYIKLLELQYTLRFFQDNPYARFPARDHDPDIGTGDTERTIALCNEILPLCAPEEKEKLQNFISSIQNFKNMQEMMQIMEMMQEIAPDLSSDAEGMDIAQTMELLQEMLS